MEQGTFLRAVSRYVRWRRRIPHESLGEAARFDSGYHLRRCCRSGVCQCVALAAPESWCAARCGRRSDLPHALSLVDDRRGISALNRAPCRQRLDLVDMCPAFRRPYRISTK